MFAVQVLSPGKAEFIETPTPVLKKGHALVRPRLLSLCGSDIFNLHYAPTDMYPMPPGSTGHEVVATVEEVADSHSGIEPGTTALVLAPSSTAMAEYYLAPIDHVLPLPPDTIQEELVQAQQLGTILYAAKFLSSNVIGKTVVVIGQGSAGLFWNWMLRRLGARYVIAIDQIPHRLLLPLQYGATHVLNNSELDAIAAVRELTSGTMADLVVEAAGEQSAVQLSFDLVRTHGEILTFGIPHFQEMEFDYYRFFRKYARLKCIAGSTDDPGQLVTRQAIDMIANGVIDVKPLITHRFSYNRVMEAYELHRTRDDGEIKIIIDMPQ